MILEERSLEERIVIDREIFTSRLFLIRTVFDLSFGIQARF